MALEVGLVRVANLDGTDSVGTTLFCVHACTCVHVCMCRASVVSL